MKLLMQFIVISEIQILLIYRYKQLLGFLKENINIPKKLKYRNHDSFYLKSEMKIIF